MEKVVLPNNLNLFIAEVVDEVTKEQEFWYVVDNTYEAALAKFFKEANKVWDRYAYYFFEAGEDEMVNFMELHENIEIGVYN